MNLTPPPPGTLPTVYANGQFLPSQQASVSIFDRGLLYGDGLFETLRLLDGQPILWDPHIERLRRGADFIHLPLPVLSNELLARAVELARLNQAANALLRITLTRGVGPRGYSTTGAGSPSLLMSLHHAPVIDPRAPAIWRLVTSRVRVHPDDPFTRFKTCNRLPYVLARQEADAAGTDDALILNTRGEVAETSTANVFCLRQGGLETPPLESGALPGVTRAMVLAVARQLGWTVQETSIAPVNLWSAEAVFLTVTSLGLIEVAGLDARSLPRSPMVRTLQTAYWRSVAGRAGTQ